MKIVITAAVLTALLLGAPAFAATFPPMKGSDGGRQTERSGTERRHEGRDHDRDREHHGGREHVRVFVIPSWDLFWGSMDAAPTPAVVVPPASLQPPAYWYYCQDPPGYWVLSLYPGVSQRLDDRGSPHRATGSVGPGGSQTGDASECEPCPGGVSGMLASRIGHVGGKAPGSEHPAFHARGSVARNAKPQAEWSGAFFFLRSRLPVAAWDQYPGRIPWPSHR